MKCCQINEQEILIYQTSRSELADDKMAIRIDLYIFRERISQVFSMQKGNN